MEIVDDVLGLDRGGLDAHGDGAVSLVRVGGADGAADASGVSSTPEPERWALLARGPVLVNGEPVLLGARLLADRDEIRIGGGAPMYFSTEELARIAPLPVTARPVVCARCRTVIVPGSPAVQCPAGDCGGWCHQTEERPCWTYPGTTSCPLCPHPSTLGDETPLWTPEDL
jgi:hypothetical protein